MALSAAALGWSLAPVFIRGLSDAYDPYTQVFLRYGSAAAPLVTISFLAYREDLRKVILNPKAMVPLAVLNVVQQCAWTHACYLGTATLAQLISKLSTVFVIVLSYLLFREERAVIKSRVYLSGTLLSFIGVALVLCKDSASLVPRFDLATWLLLLVAVCWAMYTVWCKHLVTDVHPAPMFTVLAVYTTIGFGVAAFLLGEPSTLLEAGMGVNLIAAVSGVVCIAMAHTMFHFAQKHLGSALSSSLILLNPLFTNAIALFLWSDERLIPTQWCGTALLLAGTLLVIWAGHRAHKRATA